MDTHDVIVIGAGLAGLRCATRLAEAGRDVVVLEAADVVGGRQRTDLIDGFRLDRGFQVLNPAYPAVKRWVDIDSLDVRAFPVGVRVRREDKTVELRHPVRHPGSICATLRSGLVTAVDAAALARWVGPVLLRPRSVISAASSGADTSLSEGWDRAGLRGPLRTEVLEPFLAGVLADGSGETSDAFAKLLVRMFVLGGPGVPAQGIGALPAHLAARAERAGASIRLGVHVARVNTGVVDITGGDTLRASAVVVAVGPDAVAGLVDLPRPETRGLQTWWFAADAAPTNSATLAVDGRRRGPIVNTVVMSNAAPSYAPDGMHLVEATCLLPSGGQPSDEKPTEAEVRRQLGEIWNADVARWRVIRRDDIPDALPVQSPPLRVITPVRLGDGLYVAGDHRDTASIQGALVSGERAARAVLADQV